MGLKPLTGRFDQRFKDQVNIRGLVTNVLEDIPQILIQFYVTRETDTSLITTLSISTAIFMLTMNIMKRMMLYFMSDGDSDVKIMPKVTTLEDVEEEENGTTN